MPTTPWPGEPPIEQAAIGKIVKMRKAGLPLRLIQEVLAKDGHQISHVAVDRILKRGLIAAIAVAGFSFAASAAAPVAKAAPKGGHHMGHHHMHRAHWRHYHRHHRDSPFCVLSLAPWCWN
jgi:hypothetical protein